MEINALIRKSDNGYEIEIVPTLDGDTLPTIATITVQYVQCDVEVPIIKS